MEPASTRRAPPEGSLSTRLRTFHTGLSRGEGVRERGPQALLVVLIGSSKSAPAVYCQLQTLEQPRSYTPPQEWQTQVPAAPPLLPPKRPGAEAAPEAGRRPT